MAEVLQASEKLKTRLLATLPGEITTAKRDLARRKAGRITKSNSVGNPDRNNPAGPLVYTFARPEDKRVSVEEKSEEIARLEVKLAMARDPGAVPVPLAHEGEIQAGLIRRIACLKVSQVVDENSMIGTAYLGFGDSETSYAPGQGVDVYVTGMSTAGITDGARIVGGSQAFQIAGAKRYETVIGGSRTVLELRPFDVEPWIDRD